VFLVISDKLIIPQKTISKSKSQNKKQKLSTKSQNKKHKLSTIQQTKNIDKSNRLKIKKVCP